MHILLADPDPERSTALAAALRGGGHRVEVVATGGAAIGSLARPAPPDLLVLEESLPDMPALEVVEAADRMAIQVPSILLGPSTDALRWIEAAHLGAMDYLPRDPEGVFVRTIAAHAEAAERRAKARRRAQHLADALESTSAAVLLVDGAGRVEHANAACTRLLGRVGRGGPATLSDVFVLEDQPRLRTELLAAVSAGDEWAGELFVARADDERVPCLVTLSPVRRSDGRADGNVLTLRDVSDRVTMEEALRAANRRLAEQAARDALTGLYNRAYFHDVLGREASRARRYGDEISVLMLDLDDFKAVNDTYDHGAGDSVLVEVARTLAAGLREGDVLARMGGDEFYVLLPHTGRDAALVVAERLRQGIAARAFAASPDIRLRTSVGVASSADVPADVKGLADALVRLADRSLLAAKREGGDRVR